MRLGFVLLLMFLASGSFGQVLVLRDEIQGQDTLRRVDVFTDSGPSTPADAAVLPSPGSKPGYLTLRYLRSFWPLEREKAIVGKGTVWLPDAGTTLSEKDFTAALVHFLQDKLVEKPDPLVSIDASFFIEGLDLPDNLPTSPSFRIENPSYRLNLLSGRQQVSFTDKNGTEKTPRFLSFQLKTLTAVPVTLSDLGPQTTLSASDWSWQTREVLSIPADFWKPEDGQLIETVKSLQTGDILRPGANCRVLLPVNQGDHVRLQVTKGALSIEIQAIALSSGRLGQTIRFHTDSGKTINAEVTGLRQALEEIP